MSEPTGRLTLALADRYRIERELGQGGMATVYLAEDLKHDRKVALKVLKPELAAVLGADRFVQEIKTTAQLQHPHILPLFDSGEADGFLYYVMPYVEGETLRDKLNRETQLGIDEAVQITVEVADALQYAHEHGVIHRDIKPENILLHAGRPMVADFGIALALSAAAGGRMTETGMSLGTPHYMSPEQATADKDITARSDIYSLASVLYEMLTGQPPHLGGSAQQIIMKIIAEPVTAVTAMRKNVPPNVAAALAKALEKLPADRFESATGFAAALTNPAFTAPSGAPGALPRSHPAAWSIAAAFVVVAVLALWGWLRPHAMEPEIREHIELGTSRRPAGSVLVGAAIAPDGSAIVFTDTAGGSVRLWIKERDELTPHALVRLPRSRDFPPGPTFSPDGRWIAYTDGTLQKIAREGGAPIQLSDSTAAFGAAWLDDGTIVFIGGSGGSVLATRSDGGPTERILGVADVASGGTIFRVTAIPATRAVLLTVSDDPAPRVVVLDLATDSVHALGVDGGIAWVVRNTVAYVTLSGQLMTEPFDTRRLVARGAPTSTIAGIRTVNQVGDAALGRDGTLLYAQGQAVAMGGDADLVSVSRSGTVTRLDTTWQANASTRSGLALSPDGGRLAVSVTDSAGGGSDIYVLRLATGVATRLTFDGASNIRPAWSPDGSSVLYASDADSAEGLWIKHADGSGRATRIAVPDSRPVWEGGWSPDGTWLLYRTYDQSTGNGDIYAVRASGDSTPIAIAATAAEETSPVVSPNGRWIAYAASRPGKSAGAGRKEVYVRPFPTGDGIWQISNHGGTEPQWSQSGKELFYRNGAGEMIAVTISESPTFTPGQDTTLFDARAYLAADDNHYYAVTPDDRHFLMLRPPTAPGGRLVLLRNWMGETGP